MLNIANGKEASVRVLVVEDERPLARALRRTLEAEGFSVMLAANGIDGDWAAREHDFDVIVLHIGADDFVSMLFSPVVLVAQLRALFLRSIAGPDPR